MITTLTGKNQVTVPAEIARQLDLKPGARLEWSIGGEPRQIVIKVKPSRKQLLEEVRAIGLRNKKPGQDPIGDLIRERVQDDIDEGMWT